MRLPGILRPDRQQIVVGAEEIGDAVGANVIADQVRERGLAMPLVATVGASVEPMHLTSGPGVRRPHEQQRVAFPARRGNGREPADAADCGSDERSEVGEVVDDLVARLRTVLAAIDAIARREEQRVIGGGDAERPHAERSGVGRSAASPEVTHALGRRDRSQNGSRTSRRCPL